MMTSPSEMAADSDIPPEKLEGECYGGSCDGKRFLHTADMKRVKLKDSDGKYQIYVWHADLSAERGKPVFVHESIEGWKV